MGTACAWGGHPEEGQSQRQVGDSVHTQWDQAARPLSRGRLWGSGSSVVLRLWDANVGVGPPRSKPTSVTFWGGRGDLGRVRRPPGGGGEQEKGRPNG